MLILNGLALEGVPEGACSRSIPEAKKREQSNAETLSTERRRREESRRTDRANWRLTIKADGSTMVNDFQGLLVGDSNGRGRVDTVGFKLVEGKGLREGIRPGKDDRDAKIAKELWKSVEKVTPSFSFAHGRLVSCDAKDGYASDLLSLATTGGSTLDNSNDLLWTQRFRKIF